MICSKVNFNFALYSCHDSRSQKRNVSAGFSKSYRLKSSVLLSLSYLLHIASSLTLGTCSISSLDRQIGGFLYPTTAWHNSLPSNMSRQLRVHCLPTEISCIYFPLHSPSTYRDSRHS